jgi:hypothetical protein
VLGVVVSVCGELGGAIVATMMPIIKAPRGKNRKEIQKKARLLRFFLSAARPMAEEITMAKAMPTRRIKNREIGSMVRV